MQRTFDPALVARILERPGAEDVAKAYAPYTWDLSKGGRCVICAELGYKNPFEIIPGSQKREWFCPKHIHQKLYLLVEVLDGKPLVKSVEKLRSEYCEKQRWASLSYSERCVEGRQRKRRSREAQLKSTCNRSLRKKRR
jgi:hypothetical protein